MCIVSIYHSFVERTIEAGSLVSAGYIPLCDSSCLSSSSPYSIIFMYRVDLHLFVAGYFEPRGVFLEANVSR